MNKLSKKFILGITVILLLMAVSTLLVNSLLTGRYYLHEKKTDINRICDRLEEEIRLTGDIRQAVSSLEQSEDITVAWVKNTENLDQVNEELRSALRDKGIGFHKFWLWNEAYDELMEDGRILRLYNQNKLNYSILVEYLKIDRNIYAAAMIIPHVSDAVRIVNTFSLFVMAGTLIIAVLLVIILVNRITRPLGQLTRFAGDIAEHKFHTVDIRTGDELETVAGSMNQMCREIERYQNELLLKNQQMEQLLDNVAHDLKTPVALIKAYAAGIRDGLDDGTFLDTIIRQNDRMGAMVENLLLLSRMEKKELTLETVALDQVLGQILEEQSILAGPGDIVFRTDIAPCAKIRSSPGLVTLIFTNLISNALKYSSGKTVEVSLRADGAGYLFEISNQTNTAPDPSKLWEPFYVGEASRNKNLSGTGLGLTLVKGGAEKLGYPLSCSSEDGTITFRVSFH